MPPSRMPTRQRAAPAAALALLIVVALTSACTSPKGAAADQFKGAGDDAKPWDPTCQTGAKEALVALTGSSDPVAVGLVFASDEDAGTFDSAHHEPVVSVTPGTNACAA